MNYRLFIDMDGVVADLDGYLDKMLNGKYISMPYEEKEKWWIDKFDPEVFNDLNVTPYKNELIDFVSRTNFKHVSFLTALPKNRDDIAVKVMRNKLSWANKHFPSIPVMFGPKAVDKKLHCRGKEDILIDDSNSNVKSWFLAGGASIKCNNVYDLNRCIKVIDSVLAR